MKKLVTILLFGVMVFSLCACGSGASTPSTPAEVKDVPTEAETTTKAEPEITKVGIGQSIETDNFKMVVESMEIMDEYKYSTSEYSSTSLYVESGYKILAVQGTIENTGSKVISDSSFAKKVVVNGDYEVTGFDVRLNFERDKSFELDPYTAQRYDLYINIPEKLAEQFATATFTLGFKDDMSVITTTYNSDGTETTDATNWFEITK